MELVRDSSPKQYFIVRSHMPRRVHIVYGGVEPDQPMKKKVVCSSIIAEMRRAYILLWNDPDAEERYAGERYNLLQIKA